MHLTSFSVVALVSLATGVAPTIALAQTPGPPSPAHVETGGTSYSDTLDDPAAAKPTARPKFQLTRWNEDWRYLQNPDNRTAPFDYLKYIPLRTDGFAHLTLSGQFREAPIFQSGTLFSDRGDRYLLQRVYLGADLHVGQGRMFAELGSTYAFDKNRPLSVTDEDHVDIQLLFADYRLYSGKTTMVGRVGRQEIVFDTTQRFLGLREGPNNRQAFDAVRADGFDKTWRLTGFYGNPVSYRPGLFDDTRDMAIDFGGVYLSRTDGQQTQSVYVFDFRNEASKFGNIIGQEDRWSLGSRLAGRLGNFDFDVEGIYQLGSVGAAAIDAWAVGSIFGYTFRDAWLSPRLGLQADFGSGDDDRADNRVGTFNPLFGKGAYFTEAPLTSFANVQHIKASVSVALADSDHVTFAVAELSRLNGGDVSYLNPLIPQLATRDERGRHLGEYLQLIWAHQFSANFSVTLEADHFFASDDLKAVGGRDLSFGKLTTNLLF